VIDTAANAVVGSPIPVGSGPVNIDITPGKGKPHKPNKHHKTHKPGEPKKPGHHG